MSEPGRIVLEPGGPFSLALAARFEFGPRAAEADAALVRLAICGDGFREHAGVVVREDERGLACELHGARDRDAVRRQVERILSLDQDGEEWAQVGERDAVIGAPQERYRGLRPCALPLALRGGGLVDHLHALRAPARRAPAGSDRGHSGALIWASRPVR